MRVNAYAAPAAGRDRRLADRRAPGPPAAPRGWGSSGTRSRGDAGRGSDVARTALKIKKG